ncbi:class C sortase [Bifidobacterium magnum]|uniref:Sortase n=1 Tax=Bifidobacterium magnum TaxID=1692 RepID=A0A087BF14_9BIFI|nr:class C sortase [Bifidobacterium magnum]KFI69614.1 Sortase [Bifidobacterium magnum]
MSTSHGPTTGSTAKKPSARENRRFWIMAVSMILLLIVGVGIILYPSIADMHNRRVSSRAVATYVEATEDLGKEERERMLADAHQYNATLVGQGKSRFLPNEEQHKHYESLMDVTGTGIMAYVSVPKISIRTPVYHGTSDTVLQIAAGHLEGTSLPVGGESTHAAFSGHTGLPSALLFTGLDRLERGDTFTVTVFDEVMTYEVSDIHVVVPTNVDNLEIQEGKDLVSLITCTPYGVNSHRLIVTGHRIPTPESVEHPVDKALVKDITLVVVAVVLTIAVVANVFIKRRRMMRGQIGGRHKK